MTRASSPVNNGKAKIALGDDTALTLSQKGRGNPFDPANYGEIVKPGELVDIVELSPLTLADRRIYNLLIANAWERISEQHGRASCREGVCKYGEIWVVGGSLKKKK